MISIEFAGTHHSMSRSHAISSATTHTAKTRKRIHQEWRTGAPRRLGMPGPTQELPRTPPLSFLRHLASYTWLSRVGETQVAYFAHMARSAHPRRWIIGRSANSIMSLGKTSGTPPTRCSPQTSRRTQPQEWRCK